MKNKSIAIIVLMVCILGIVGSCVYANNTVSNVTNVDNSMNSTVTSTATKSSNANLNDLGIKPNDFTGFKYGTTTYNVEVPKDVSEVEIYAKFQDSKATLVGTGKKKLEEGKNTFDVIVTAEDGTKKTYTLNITRGETEERTTRENISEISSGGLASLDIEGLSLTPGFRADIYEYSVKYVGEKEQLNINAKALKEDYIVEVVGNEGLKIGENLINILIYDKEGNNVSIYQINVEKVLEGVNDSKGGIKKETIIGIFFVIGLVILVIALVIRKRNNEYDEEFDYENQDEELPKAFTEKEDDIGMDFTEEISKEELKKKFLDGYSIEEIMYDEEKSRSKPRNNKGKRFK